MVDTLRTLGHKLTEVHITELEGGTFYAVLLVDGIEVSARPSDAIALALRVGSDIYCAEDVLDEAGIEIPEAEEDEVEKFREFLDQVNPDDFVTGEEPKRLIPRWTARPSWSATTLEARLHPRRTTACRWPGDSHASG